ncbi:hypothetical protein ACIOMM_20125 [Streptomyces sp. NPDC087908]|uniref:hypothetical protein n=1 Tax=unclassified Streptomyces TaxID=2593676 RepID=UPI0011CDDD77|nr:hypothetical protein [Streptomyces sp. adm13(2018)]
MPEESAGDRNPNQYARIITLAVARMQMADLLGRIQGRRSGFVSAELDRIIGDMQPMGDSLRIGNATGLFAYPAAFGPGEASEDAAADLAAFGDMLREAASDFADFVTDVLAAGKILPAEGAVPELVALAHLADEVSRGASVEDLAEIKQQIISSYSSRLSGEGK